LKKISLSGQNPIQIKLSARLEQLNEVILNAIQDIKAIDVVKLDLTKIPDAGAQFFFICHGNSTTHVAGIIDSVQRKVQDLLGLQPNHVEGKEGRQWMLVDYFSTLVHVFTPDKRFYYNLEQLWSDAVVTKYENQ
jgi:ribosome-associated protein